MRDKPRKGSKPKPKAEPKLHHFKHKKVRKPKRIKRPLVCPICHANVRSNAENLTSWHRNPGWRSSDTITKWCTGSRRKHVTL